MNIYLVTLRINGQLIKSVVLANSATHARLLCQYQFGMDCVQAAPTELDSEGHDYALLDNLKQPSPTVKPRPPKTATIKPAKPPTPEQMRITQLKANVDRQKQALERERESQKRQREAEQARRAQGGV